MSSNSDHIPFKSVNKVESIKSRISSSKTTGNYEGNFMCQLIYITIVQILKGSEL